MLQCIALTRRKTILQYNKYCGRAFFKRSVWRDYLMLMLHLMETIEEKGTVWPWSTLGKSCVSLFITLLCVAPFTSIESSNVVFHWNIKYNTSNESFNDIPPDAGLKLRSTYRYRGQKWSTFAACASLFRSINTIWEHAIRNIQGKKFFSQCI